MSSTWYLEVDSVIGHRRDIEYRYKLHTLFKQNNAEAWLPIGKLPSATFLLEYYKTLFYTATDDLCIDTRTKDLYDLIGAPIDSEIQVMAARIRTIQGLVSRPSKKCKILSDIKTFLKERKRLETVEVETLRREILLEEILRMRQDMHRINMDREVIINMLSLNKKYISISNDVDLVPFPVDLIYTERYLFDSNIQPPEDVIAVGCDCLKTEECSSGDCFHEDSLPDPPYAEDRVLFSVGTPIYECNDFCSCNITCPRRVIQRRSNLRLEIFRTFSGIGWAIRTLETITKGSFICVYTGEVVRWTDAEDRLSEYLFDLDFNYDTQKSHCPFTVDAEIYGNVSRFFNHSCKPNLTVYSVYVNNVHPELPHVGFFAAQDIQIGEELTFHYGKFMKVKGISCKCAKHV